MRSRLLPVSKCGAMMLAALSVRARAFARREDRAMNALPVMLLLVILTISGANGQSIDAYGFKGGLTYSTHARTMDDFMAEDHLRQGLTFGGFAQWHVSRVFFLSAELLYAQRGDAQGFAYIDPASFIPYERFEPRADYLSIPLLAGVRMGARGTPPFLYLGPRLDILVSSDGFSDLHRLVAGVTGGLGIQFTISESSVILLEARMSGGLTDAWRYPDDTFWSYEFLAGIIR